MENLTIHLPAKNAKGINGKMRAAHIGLRTPDYKATVNWYTEKLGFRVIKDGQLANYSLPSWHPLMMTAFG